MQYLLLLAWLLGLLHLPLGAQEPVWDSLSGMSYRPGHWWTLYWQSPVDFPGSSQRATLEMNKLHLTIPGLTVRTATTFFYLPWTASPPHISLTWEVPSAEVRTDRKTFRLQALPRNSWAVARHGTDTVPFPDGTETPYQHLLPMLPDCVDGLTMFDVCVLGNQLYTENDLVVLQEWVQMGGLLFLEAAPTRHIMFHAWLARQEQLLNTFSLMSSPQICYFRAGLGHVVYVKDSTDNMPKTLEQTIWQRLWPLLVQLRQQSQQLQLSRFSPPFAELMPTPHVSRPWRARIGLVCTAYLLVMACVSWYTWRRYTWKTNLLLLSVITALASLGAYGLMITRVPVSYKRLTLVQLLPQQNTTVTYAYHAFYALRHQSWSHTFPSLPMPICGEGQNPGDVAFRLFRSPDGWTVDDAEFHSGKQLTYHTRRCGNMDGFLKVRQEQDGIQVSNDTNWKLSHVLYRLPSGFYPLGHLMPGQSLSVPADLHVTRQPIEPSNLPGTYLRFPQTLRNLGRAFTLPMLIAEMEEPHSHQFACADATKWGFCVVSPPE